MKTLFIVLSALTIASLSSCKKSYSCSCTTVFTAYGTTTNSTTETTTDTYSEKMKEKQAKSACDVTQTRLAKSNQDHANDLSQAYGINTSVTTRCEVK